MFQWITLLTVATFLLKKTHSTDYKSKSLWLKCARILASENNIWNPICWQKWSPGNTCHHPGPPTFHQHNQLIPPPLSLLPFLLMYIHQCKVWYLMTLHVLRNQYITTTSLKILIKALKYFKLWKLQHFCQENSN